MRILRLRWLDSREELHIEGRDHSRRIARHLLDLYRLFRVHYPLERLVLRVLLHV